MDHRVFYMNFGILASLLPACLHVVLAALVGLFERVGLCINVNKTAGMVCKTCLMSDRHSVTAYTSMMTGVVTY